MFSSSICMFFLWHVYVLCAYCHVTQENVYNTYTCQKNFVYFTLDSHSMHVIGLPHMHDLRELNLTSLK